MSQEVRVGLLVTPDIIELLDTAIFDVADLVLVPEALDLKNLAHQDKDDAGIDLRYEQLRFQIEELSDLSPLACKICRFIFLVSPDKHNIHVQVEPLEVHDGQKVCEKKHQLQEARNQELFLRFHVEREVLEYDRTQVPPSQIVEAGECSVIIVFDFDIL